MKRVFLPAKIKFVTVGLIDTMIGLPTIHFFKQM
jgi:hypothetical protein